MTFTTVRPLFRMAAMTGGTICRSKTNCTDMDGGINYSGDWDGWLGDRDETAGKQRSKEVGMDASTEDWNWDSDRDEWVRNRDVPQAGASQCDNGTTRTPPIRAEQGEAERVHESGVGNRAYNHRLALARASYRYAAEALERGSSDRKCCKGCRCPTGCRNWESAVRFLRSL